MCAVPSQVIKHLTGKVLEPLTALLNKCVHSNLPPRSLNITKLAPLYKGVGDVQDPDNYRALAVMHPIAKLIMGILNVRL